MSVDRKRGLGKGLTELGLNELLGGGPLPGGPVSKVLPWDALRPGRYQPRRDMDAEALKELSVSIKAQGIIQPIIVRSPVEGQYEIVAGERRWRAARLAGVDSVPVIVRDIDDAMAMAVGIIENVQREDLNAMEAAYAFERLGEEFAMTHEAIAESVGKSRSSVTNLLRLLRLEEPVKALVEQGELEMGHARALLAIKGDEQVEAAQAVVKRGLSVRAAEGWVRRYCERVQGGSQVEPLGEGRRQKAREVGQLVEGGAEVDRSLNEEGSALVDVSQEVGEQLLGVRAQGVERNEGRSCFSSSLLLDARFEGVCERLGKVLGARVEVQEDAEKLGGGKLVVYCESRVALASLLASLLRETQHCD